MGQSLASGLLKDTFKAELVMIVYVFNNRIVGDNLMGLKTAMELRLNNDNVVVGLLNVETYVVRPIY